MVSNALMRRRGNLVDCGTLTGPLPRQVAEAIEAQLTYTHIKHLRGADTYDNETGVRSRVKSFNAKLFKYDTCGRMVFPAGFRPRVRRILSSFGIPLQEQELDGPRPRPNCFNFHPERIFERFGVDAFRARQDEALLKIISSEGGILVAPPAFGKTHLFKYLALALPDAKIDITTDRQDVAQTIRSRLMSVIPTVGMVGGGENRPGKRITVYVADSLHKAPHDDGEADILLYDEVHEGATETALNNLAKYQRARKYGFTGSFGKRGDNADARLEGVFGEVLFYMSVIEATQLGLITPAMVEWVPVEMRHNPADDFKRDVDRERAGIWANDYRNQLIAAQAERFTNNEQLLIMVKSIEHGLRLRRYLPGYEFCYDKISEVDRAKYIAMGLLSQDEPTMTKPRRHRLRAEFESGQLRRCIANDVWSTGVDFVQLSVLIRADARASKILSDQIPGRAIRLHEEKNCALIIDMWDRFDNSWLRNSQTRKSCYTENGWTSVMLPSPGVYQ